MTKKRSLDDQCSPKIQAPGTKKRDKMFGDEEDHGKLEDSFRDTPQNSGNIIIPELQNMNSIAQPQYLDPEKIYLDKENEIYFHVCGMCFNPDPRVKSYYTINDQEGWDLRPLYYIQ